MANASLIDFKGTKNGLLIHMDETASFDEVMQSLYDKYALSKNFFNGAKLIGMHGRKLSDEERDIVKKALSDRFGMVISETSFEHIDLQSIYEEEKQQKSSSTHSQNKSSFKTNSESTKSSKSSTHEFSYAIDEGQTKFLKGTLRSGYSENYEGNLVVLGDVNPGAEIFATGNILVLGHVRGVVHAGSKGDHTAWVMALKLQPTQLRIGPLITRSPDDNNSAPTEPEIAYIKDKMIVIEPYKSK